MKRLRKQERSSRVRIFIICLIFFATLGPVRAEAVYFVSLAWIKAEQQQFYARFHQAVQPIWARHNMQVLTRTTVVDILAGPDTLIPPHEIAVLRVPSLEVFQAYISDPDYQTIKQERLQAVDQMFVLEGKTTRDPNWQYIQSAPQFAIILGEGEELSPLPLIEIDISQVGAIKGTPLQPYSDIKSVALYGLSYDDNPLSFLDQLKNDALVYVAATRN